MQYIIDACVGCVIVPGCRRTGCPTSKAPGAGTCTKQTNAHILPVTVAAGVFPEEGGGKRESILSDLTAFTAKAGVQLHGFNESDEEAGEAAGDQRRGEPAQMAANALLNALSRTCPQNHGFRPDPATTRRRPGDDPATGRTL